MEDKYQGPQKIDLRDDGSASPGKAQPKPLIQNLYFKK